MPDRAISLKSLRRILKSFGCAEDPSRGKGSHTLFTRQIDEKIFSYPIPTTNNPVLVCYVRGVRKKFQLTREDGVSDEDFYGRG